MMYANGYTKEEQTVWMWRESEVSAHEIRITREEHSDSVG